MLTLYKLCTVGVGTEALGYILFSCVHPQRAAAAGQLVTAWI